MSRPDGVPGRPGWAREVCEVVGWSLPLIRQSLMTAGPGGAGHVTHTRRGTGGGCEDVSVHLRLDDQSLEECRLSNLSRENRRIERFLRVNVPVCLTLKLCQEVKHTHRQTKAARS